MNIKHGIRATLALAAAAAALALTGGAASAAIAAPAPGTPLVAASPNGWQSLTYRPGRIHVGNGASPFVYNLSWGSWSTSAATTRSGRIRQYWPNGGPSYTWPSTTRPVKVYLHDVKTHRGQPYFAKMRWNWTNARGVAKVAYWLFGYEGGTVPGWIVR